MKIAIIGYGRMGHAVEQIALDRGHSIVCRIDAGNDAAFESPEFRSADVAIDFSQPSVAEANCRRALAAGVSVVSGTTGWSAGVDALRSELPAGVAFLWSSNFSLGVNLFFVINRYVTTLLSRFPQYKPEMEEVHHIHKLDHPSGTAITLANALAECSAGRITSWTEDAPPADNALLIRHRREGEVPGIHTVEWDSPVDTITISHSAKSRQGFALGAVMAAEWLAPRTGFFTMEQMMHSIIPSSLTEF